MSEKLYAWLLCLYPAAFREAHRDDLLQLFRDRLRDETGILRRARLWRDIAFDLATTVPHLHAQPSALAAGSSGTTMFLPLPNEPLRPAAMLSALAVALVTYSFLGFLMAHAGSTRMAASGAEQSQTAQANSTAAPTDRTAIQTDPTTNSTDSTYPAEASTDSSAVPADPTAAQAYSTATEPAAEAPAPGRVYAFSPAGIGASISAAPVSRHSFYGRPFNPEHQFVIDGVVTNLKQHYYDPAVAQRLADDLVLRFRHGDDAGATDQEFASLITAQLRNASGDASLLVVYRAPARLQPSDKTESAQGNDCSFSKARMLSGRIGFLKLEHVLASSDCAFAAASALGSLKKPEALVIDFRDDHDGSSERLSFISSDFMNRSTNPPDRVTIQGQPSRPSIPMAASGTAKMPVYILSSYSTVAAVQPFMHALKTLQRPANSSTVTAGEADIWRRIDDRYAIAVPEGPAMNARGQGDLLDARLRPGIRVPASEAFDTAIGFARARVQAQRKSPRHE
ncbi:MAG TPA: hypothetical protein VGN16_20195 [Acidobacteriaceae bacterium]|jgi:hypothetical protein